MGIGSKQRRKARKEEPAAPEPVAGDSAAAARRWSLRTWAAVIGLAVIAAVSLTSAATWYRERPLAAADVAIDAGEIETAIPLVSEFLERYPDHSRALALKARLLVHTRQPVEAIRIFDRIGAASAKDLHALARAYLLQQHWSMAMPLLEQTTRLDPQNADALYELTSCRVRLGFLQEALSSAQEFARLPGHAARGHVFMGSIHGDLKNRDQAAAAYAKVLETDPRAGTLQVTASEFFDEYGRTLLALGQGEQALTMFLRSRETQASADNWTLTGRAYASLGQTDQAVEAWKNALNINPQHEEARENLAGVELQANRPQQALEWIAELESKPTLASSTAYLFQRAYTLLKDEPQMAAWTQRTEELRKSEQVHHAIESILIEAPQTFWARVIRAYRFAQQGNWTQAQSIMGPLAKEAPNEPFVRDLAQALQQHGNLPSLDRLPIQRH